MSVTPFGRPETTLEDVVESVDELGKKLDSILDQLKEITNSIQDLKTEIHLKD
jgi:peptidoglycan hydrolase CwlO-like protein